MSMLILAFSNFGGCQPTKPYGMLVLELLYHDQFVNTLIYF